MTTRRKTTRKKRPDRLLAVLHAARSRARKEKKGTPRAEYDLDDHLPELRRRFKLLICELTGIPFDMKAARRREWNSPSIDRIDSTRGYTLDNVRFILWSLNAALGPYGEAVYARVATAYLARRHA